MDDEITVEELRATLDSGASGDATGDDVDDDASSDTNGDGDTPRIVDIRNPELYRRGHIPGSENIPASELTARVEELDGSGRVVTVCPHGKASVQAARLVASYEGVDGPVESLAGGLEAWDGPLESDDPEADRDPDGDGEPTAPF